ncbi:hypothetical protein JB92DRAFT_2997300 [Gautieria morchelliformis]|nr:hypothetical protein JB92DRAFT_2997300 [Gautieria morchelliformis]
MCLARIQMRRRRKRLSGILEVISRGYQGQPTYRSADVAELFYHLDLARIAEQKKKRARTRKGTPFHPTMVGNPVEKELPIVEKNRNRIRKEFLDEEWLSVHEEDENDDTKLRVYDSREEEEEKEEEERAGRGAGQVEDHAQTKQRPV